MTIYQSVYIDDIVLSSSYHRWQVHSLFDNVINLSSESSPHLLTITHVSYPLLPYGIHLMPYDFSRLRNSLQINEQLIGRQHLLGNNKMSIDLSGHHYCSQLKLKNLLQPYNMLQLIQYITQLSVSNGFGQTFMESVEDEYHPIKQLILSAEKDDQVQSLIGRGIGLTPTGDDMLIGYNLMAICQGKPILYPDLSLTTDISRHYLYCSTTKRFHNLLLQLINLLTQRDLSFKRLQVCIENILSFGHTSGADILTGFILSNLYMRGVDS